MINTLAAEINANAKEKGFTHDNFPRSLLLIISEVTEAMEADRKDDYYNPITMKRANAHRYWDWKEVDENPITHRNWFVAEIKDTVQDEIADAMIRLMDLGHSLGMDMNFHIREKMRYNAERGYKHGNKKY